MTATRRDFYSPEEVFEKVRMKVKLAKIKGEHIDYLSFVPDGEPTLDINLGIEIDLLKALGFKIAVFTNASMLLDHNVRSELAKADLVSVKIDACNPLIWKMLNRPHKAIFFAAVLDGILLFKETFKGRLIAETMLVRGVNESYGHIYDLSGFLQQVSPDTAYLAIPTRPPLLKTVVPPNEKKINTCYQILDMKVNHVEYLTGYEGNEFASIGSIENDILSTVTVHPLREDAIAEMLKKAEVGWDIVDTLINQKKIVETKYDNNRFYVRKFTTS
jgi:wyosine [tRNA(Phe)-imidazoG37] synthetase (radical SAM superfamily)